MSIYKKALGSDFENLHPMLQKRYDLHSGDFFRAAGMMSTIKGGPRWLYPLFLLGTQWKLLFPEHGRRIPFSILNRARTAPNGEEQIHWERIFHFGQKIRYFNALMSLDEKRLVIKDYLGEPALLYSDLVFTVSNEGSLYIQSKDQRLVIGKFEVPLPTFLQGLATVREGYDDLRDVYTINVNVRNPLIGNVFSYEGEFIQDA